MPWTAQERVIAWCRECGEHFDRPDGSLAQRCPKCEAEATRVGQWLTRERPRSVVTPALFGLNVAVFLATVAGGASFFSPSAEQLLRWGAEYGPLVFAGQWWRLLAAMFLHFGILHLALNMWCLWQLGFLAEFLFGRVTFLVLYILSGLGGGVLSLLMHPTVVSAGASGAIFGVAGGVAAFLWLHRLDFHAPKLTGTLPSVAVFIGYNLLYGFSDPQIDNAGHLGGLIVGAVLGALVPRPKLEMGRFARLQFPLAAAAVTALIAYGAARARH